jgi:hypothetical protein
MSDLRKAAQELLDSWDKPFEFPPASTRFEALRAALAQPEPFNPEWDRVKALEESLREHMAEIHRLKALAQPEPAGAEDMKVYAAIADGYNKRQRKPLTDEEIDLVCAPLGFAQMCPREVARAIEKAHGIGGEHE